MLRKGIAVDVAGRKIYWTEEGKIRRANLNGNSRQDVARGLGTPVSIALGVAPARAPSAPAAVAAAPDATALHPNYPNPFNPETWIPYQLQKSADVQISITVKVVFSSVNSLLGINAQVSTCRAVVPRTGMVAIN